MSHELGVEVDLAEIDAELKEYIRNGISEYFRRSVRAPLLERIGLILFPDTNTETANDLLKQLFTWAIPQLSTGVRRKAAHELLLTGGTLQDRRGRAAKHYRRKPVRNKRSEWTLHPETFRTGAKYEPAIREELGIILRDAARAGRGARAGLSDENNAADSYIPRPDMEQKYIKLPAQERQLALLYGDAGTGKSMLAKSVARHITFDEADILTLHAGSEDLLIRAMNDFIQRDQGDAPSGHKAIVAAEFAQLLTQPQAPRVVIIDNVADWQEARLLLPENLSDLRSFVIITSREQILPNGTGVALLVDNMTQPQAAAMVKDRVPSISDSDADSLATELDCRPLAIEHGCALIRQYKMQAQDFIAMLRADVVALFDAAPTTEMKLTAIYRRMIERISTDPSLVNATKLLGVLLVVEAMVDDTLVSNIWMELSKANERGSHSGFHMVQELALKSATQDLQRLALIQVEPEEDHNMLRMHDLTHSILHSLRVREIAEIAEAALRAVAETLDTEQWTLGDPLPHEWMHWTGSAERIFHSLKMGQTDADKAVFTSPPALHLSAFLLRTRRQWGSPCHQCMQRAARQHEQCAEEHDEETSYYRYELARELVGTGWLRYNGPCCPYRSPLAIIRELDTPQLYDPVVGDFWYPVETLVEQVATEPDVIALPFIGNVEDHDNVEAARCLLLNGTLLAEGAQWEEAEHILLSAFERADGNGLSGLYVQYDAIRRGLTMNIQADHLDKCEQWLDLLRGVSARDRGEMFLDDRTIKAQVKRTEADVALAKLFNTGARDGDRDIETCDTLIELYSSLENDHRENENFILWPPVAYQLGRAYAYKGDLCSALDWFNRCHQYSHTAEFSRFGTHISALAQLKLTAAHEASHGRDYTSLADRNATEAIEIANQINESYRSPYWHADALLTAWVILTGLNIPDNADSNAQLEQILFAMLNEIGRTDRLTLARKTVSGELGSAWLLAD